MDSNYLSEEIKKQGIAVSFKDMVSGNTTVIRKTILNALNLGGIWTVFLLVTITTPLSYLWIWEEVSLCIIYLSSYLK